MPRILLLGGHGKVALHLTPLLLARSWHVTSVIRNPQHREEILALATNKKGTLEVLLSSLEDVKSQADAQAIIDTAKPNYVIWSAGAGGKGGASRTLAIDRDAFQHFVAATGCTASITKFLHVSYLGARRVKPSWMPDDQWSELLHVNQTQLAVYTPAKIDAEECLVAMAAKRKKLGAFQAISLRPGFLSDETGTGMVSLGKTGFRGTVTREDVAVVIDRMLARDDTQGWYDLLNGTEFIEEAVERVVREKVDAIEGEDVQGMLSRFGVEV